MNDPFSGIEDEKLVLVTESGEVDVEEGVDAAEMSLGPEELSGEEEAGPSATLVTPNTSLHYIDSLATHGSTGEYYSLMFDQRNVHSSLCRIFNITHYHYTIKSFHSPLQEPPLPLAAPGPRPPRCPTW